MSLQPGTHVFGPDNATLSVHTGRTGAAAKAGHDLVIDVTEWQATLEVGDRASIALDADATSLRVRDGTGGIQALGDDDKASIQETIHEDVLKGQAISFRSTSVEVADGAAISVQGELTLVGTARPIELELAMDDAGTLRGSIAFKQSDWEIAPYSTLFGALKVADEVTVVIDAALPAG